MILNISQSTILLIPILITGVLAVRSKNESLSCYQCVRHADVQCDPDDLLPCPKNKDRCVTHLFKDDSNPLTIKRECGLGPCDFGDESMNRGLGLDVCDRTKNRYFCVFCCTESGCNRGNTAHYNIKTVVAISTTMSIVFKFCYVRWMVNHI